jgi:hypothetical protein
MLNSMQCRLIIKGYLCYYDAYVNCKENDRKAMFPVLKDLKIEFDKAVKRLSEIDNMTGGENV